MAKMPYESTIIKRVKKDTAPGIYFVKEKTTAIIIFISSAKTHKAKTFNGHLATSIFFELPELKVRTIPIILKMVLVCANVRAGTGYID